MIRLPRLAWWRRLLFLERGDVVLNAGAGGSTAAADAVGGVQYQKVKLNLGGAGVDGGLVYTTTSINAAASNNATSVKATAGTVYGVHIYSNAAYPIYVKLYNKATAPAPATDNGLLIRRIGVQSGTQRDMLIPAGISFSSGIGLAIVKGISDTDNTAVLVNDCLAEVDYA